MILIISNKGDIHCNPVIKHFQNANIPYFRLNTEELTNDYKISFYYKDNIKSVLRLENKKNKKILLSNEVKAVWDRRPLSQKIQFNGNKEIKKIIEDEVNELNLWIRYYFHDLKMIGSSVLDRPNESKIRQVNVAKQTIHKNNLDVHIPQTIITNELNELLTFLEDKTHVVLKPIGSDAYQVDDIYEIPFVSLKKVAEEVQESATQEDLDLCPVFVQEYIDKEFELRVTSVGSKNFCCKIDSQKLPKGKGREDWREGYDSGLKDLQEGIETPEVISNFCKEFLKEINSSFGCFDFIKGIDGNYYFLECNPNGQWLWIEEDIGLSISKEIADYLNG
jgi:hypothetical protein